MKPEYAIPQDVWETAEAFAMKMRLAGYTSQHAAPIARAIMAERVRCLAICEELSTAGALDAAEHIRNGISLTPSLNEEAKRIGE